MSASASTGLMVRALRSGAAGGLTRALMTTLLDPGRRRAVAEALSRFEEQRVASLLRSGTRHPMAPAAVRVERTRSRGRRGEAGQVAVTMWFGDGPDLPAPGGRSGRGAAVRVGAGVVSAAAIAAASTLVARMGERQQVKRLPAPAPRIDAGGEGAQS